MRWVENTVLQLLLQVVLGCHFEGVQRLRNLIAVEISHTPSSRFEMTFRWSFRNEEHSDD